ncbi:uncharacterized protein TrAFT101_005873 [Trichoderma asperellum]|uniref:Uncharacterized protein n=1 Tax=Trichoderma asperellum (strain ATCC 204424 / CBS 433.97 / NBRC 101777) TaxID=1042311 RepID=A0A2T3Z7D2_TRIA4|nr:hypothetical protein M441DRAFT_58188 [Trichoderma asperellum CBS 433.97]PTB40706.1 hypothetical protein M441DRAFT_58188 [Trichoderma asperellum CBS 433.97]UKZ90874.1 hypothetical protein TrAFT101_005873 [Trichoderma asperellum]
MATLLKRKRSASELCSPGAANSMMDASVPANLHSRTLKRYRDNRPSDDEVHRKFYEWRAHHHLSIPNSSSCAPAEHTLGLLYSAQQRPQQQQFRDEAPTAAAPPVAASSSSNHQQSLHRFWSIGSEPSSASSSPGIENPPAPLPTSCDDCGAALAGGSRGDEMDVDSSDAVEDTACGACGKHVCFSCSVSNLGEQKRCLQCAGRRVWIGGIGWTTAGFGLLKQVVSSQLGS